jgi:hypothetical protein
MFIPAIPFWGAAGAGAAMFIPAIGAWGVAAMFIPPIAMPVILQQDAPPRAVGAL